MVLLLRGLLSVLHCRNAVEKLVKFSHWGEYKGATTCIRLSNYPPMMESFPTTCICFDGCDGPSLTQFSDSPILF